MSSIVSTEDAKQALDLLLDRGCRNVIITMGASGCLLASQEDRTHRHVECPQVKAVDTTVSKQRGSYDGMFNKIK